MGARRPRRQRQTKTLEPQTPSGEETQARQEWRAAERRVQTTRDWYDALARRIGVAGFGDVMNAAWAQYSRRNEVWPYRPADTPPEANGKSDALPEREDHGELIYLLKHTYAAIVELAE